MSAPDSREQTSPADRYASEPSWAVVGASNDPGKFGNRIYITLRSVGYRVRAVNVRESQVAGDEAFSSLVELPEVPTVVNLVVPPSVAPEVVRDAIAIGARAIWFQPGAENREAAALAREHGLEVIEDCILRRYRNLS